VSFIATPDWISLRCDRRRNPGGYKNNGYAAHAALGVLLH